MSVIALIAAIAYPFGLLTGVFIMRPYCKRAERLTEYLMASRDIVAYDALHKTGVFPLGVGTINPTVEMLDDISRSTEKEIDDIYMKSLLSGEISDRELDRMRQSDGVIQ